MIHHTHESGRSLTEMMAVLGIIGVLTVGIVSGIQFGMTSFRVNALYNTIETTASGVIDLYSWSRKYPESDDASTMADQILSNDICDDCKKVGNNAAVTTPWGTLTVAPAELDHFQMTLDTVPYSVCQQLKDLKWQHVVWAAPLSEDKPACTDASGETKNIIFHVY